MTQAKTGLVVAPSGVTGACGPSATDPEPGAVSVNTEAVAAKFYAEDPGEAAELVDNLGRRFLIKEEDKASIVPVNTVFDLRHRTGVSSMKDNQIYFAPGEYGWNDAYITKFHNPGRFHFVEGTFGNGATIPEIANPVALPAV